MRITNIPFAKISVCKNIDPASGVYLCRVYLCVILSEVRLLNKFKNAPNVCLIHSCWFLFIAEAVFIDNRGKIRARKPVLTSSLKVRFSGKLKQIEEVRQVRVMSPTLYTYTTDTNNNTALKSNVFLQTVFSQGKSRSKATSLQKF